MPRIKINDLPKDVKISKEEMQKITGGETTYLIQSNWTLSSPRIFGKQPVIMEKNDAEEHIFLTYD